MTKRVLVALVVLANRRVFGAGSWVGWRSAGVPADAASPRELLYYSCPMHPAYHSDRPGDCPSCGMRLEPRTRGARAGRMRATSASGAGAGQGEPGAPAGHRRAGRPRRANAGHARHPHRPGGSPPTSRASTGSRPPRTAGSNRRCRTRSAAWCARTKLLGTFYAREFLSAQQAYFYALDAKDRFMAQNAGEAQMAVDERADPAEHRLAARAWA